MVDSFSGRLGNLLFKQYPNGVVVSKMPDRSMVKLSVKQKKANKDFQQAVHFAKTVLAHKSLQKQYTKEVKKGKSLYDAALSSYLKKIS